MYHFFFRTRSLEFQDFASYQILLKFLFLKEEREGEQKERKKEKGCHSLSTSSRTWNDGMRSHFKW
jgi:hypothetical protein